MSLIIRILARSAWPPACGIRISAPRPSSHWDMSHRRNISRAKTGLRNGAQRPADGGRGPMPDFKETVMSAAAANASRSPGAPNGQDAAPKWPWHGGQGDEAEKVGIHDFNFFYGPTQALKSIHLSFQDHRITALIGPSGCGKSTV